MQALDRAMWGGSITSTLHGNSLICRTIHSHGSHCRRDAASTLCFWQETISNCCAGHHARVFDVAFSPTDSAVLASASDDESCRVWRQDGSDTTQVQFTCQAIMLSCMRRLPSVRAYIAVQEGVSTSHYYRDVMDGC